MQEQAAKLCTVAPQHANAARSEAARLIAEHTPGDLNKIFFTNGGADANEHAVRMARLHTGRHKVLTRYRSYHGGTDTAINLTGDPRRWPNDYGNSGVVHFFGPFLYRIALPRHHRDGGNRARAGTSGRRHPPGGAVDDRGDRARVDPRHRRHHGAAPGYLAGVRELCDRYGIVFIADEVMAGFGRSGKWFAVDHFDVTPDLITFAKGVNSGYVPLGGVAISPAIASTFADRPYPGGLTYSGHPLATAAAAATISVMREERIVENAARVGAEVIGPGLHELARRHPSVGEVRGLGVFWAIELVKNQATREPLAPYGGSSTAMNAVIASCKAQGLLPFANFNRIHVVPPCTVTDAQAREGLAILDAALDVADESLG